MNKAKASEAAVSAPKGNDPMRVPVLTYGRNNNFALFKKNLKVKALQLFGDLARIITDHAYYDPPEVDQKRFDVDNDKLGLNLDRLKKAVVRRDQAIEKMVEERPKLYAFIVEKLSLESLDAVSTKPGFEEFSVIMDPLALWKAIEATHKVGSDSRIEVVEKMEARNEYQSVQQGSFEKIVAFKERFVQLREAYTETGNAELSDQDIAMDFLRALDNNKYREFKSSLLNAISNKSVQPPANLFEVYRQAAEYLPVNDAEKPSSAVFAVISKLKKEVNQLKKKVKSAKGKEDITDKPSSSEDKPGSSEDKPGRYRKGYRKVDITKVKCYNCEQFGHYKNMCPNAESDEEVTTEKANVVHHSEDDPDEDDESEKVNVVYHIGDRGIGSDKILLDNQASSSFIQPHLLTDIHQTTPIVVESFNGDATVIDKKGKLEDFFECYVAPKGSPNVLSLAEVEDRYNVEYHQGAKFEVQLANGKVMEFRRENNT